MATEKSSEEDAKTLDDSNDSTQNGSNASVAKSNGSKPNGAKSSVDEIRKRAYEIFQERQGGSELGDWQKAEASVSADASKADAGQGSTRSKADASKADAAKADSSKAEGQGDGPRRMRLKVCRYQLIPGRSRRRSPSSSRVSSMD